MSKQKECPSVGERKLRYSFEEDSVVKTYNQLVVDLQQEVKHWKEIAEKRLYYVHGYGRLQRRFCDYARENPPASSKKEALPDNLRSEEG